MLNGFAQQQDACEFLNCLLHKIRNELCSVTAELLNNDKIFLNLYGSHVQFSLHCQNNCPQEYRNPEEEQILILPIPKISGKNITLYDCFKYYTEMVFLNEKINKIFNC